MAVLALWQPLPQMPALLLSKLKGVWVDILLVLHRDRSGGADGFLMHGILRAPFYLELVLYDVQALRAEAFGAVQQGSLHA